MAFDALRVNVTLKVLRCRVGRVVSCRIVSLADSLFRPHPEQCARASRGPTENVRNSSSKHHPCPQRPRGKKRNDEPPARRSGAAENLKTRGQRPHQEREQRWRKQENKYLCQFLWQRRNIFFPGHLRIIQLALLFFSFYILQHKKRKIKRNNNAN